jgi:RNA polymerase sigma factor (sigma-70 family)
MRAMPNGLMARQLERLFRQGTAPQGDRALLEWFVSKGDDTAFEALVARHGPMVLGVCRRLLGSPHDADDAFQATFLVLVQKARSLRDADRLGPWLYGVATRVATRARVRAASRRDRLGVLVDDLPSPESGASEWLDVRPILDAELGQLPAKYREVLVICLLEGCTAEEAAQQLACPLGTVKSRLARGREALRVRLTGRGLAPAIALVVVAGTARSALASHVPQTLFRTTLQMVGVAGSASASLSPAVVALTKGVTPSMFTKSSLMAAVALGGIALSGLGIAAWMKTPVLAQEPGKEPAGRAGIFQGARNAAARSTTQNNLKQIMLALHNYQDANGGFPPAAIYGKDGQPLLSWRVALLPYLEKAKLYEKFHMDEPWDSEHNMPLSRSMPDVFKTPNNTGQMRLNGQIETRIQGFHGKGAFFEGITGVKIPDITDGTSNTIAIALSATPTIWTKPGDLPFVEGAPLPALDETDAFYMVGLADGSVRSMPTNAKGMPPLLKKMITRNGGEIIDFSELEAPPPAGGVSGGPGGGSTPAGPTPGAMIGRGGRPGGVGMMASMAAGGAAPALAPELEQRLQRMESKLDEILKRLNTNEPAAAGGGLLKP